MKVLFFKGIDGNEIEPEDTAIENDMNTVEFEAGCISNIDVDDGIIRIYTEGGHWYFMLEPGDAKMLLEALQRR